LVEMPTSGTLGLSPDLRGLESPQPAVAPDEIHATTTTSQPFVIPGGVDEEEVPGAFIEQHIQTAA
jgi:hypothetical protein